MLETPVDIRVIRVCSRRPTPLIPPAIIQQRNYSTECTDRPTAPLHLEAAELAVICREEDGGAGMLKTEITSVTRKGCEGRRVGD